LCANRTPRSRDPSPLTDRPDSQTACRSRQQTARSSRQPSPHRPHLPLLRRHHHHPTPPISHSTERRPPPSCALSLLRSPSLSRLDVQIRATAALPLRVDEFEQQQSRRSPVGDHAAARRERRRGRLVPDCWITSASVTAK
jgi:hypothetical protein